MPETGSLQSSARATDIEPQGAEPAKQKFYAPGRSYDEMFAANGSVRPHYAALYHRMTTLQPADMAVEDLPEHGRGLAIMEACVDDVSLRTGPGRGTVVSLRKHIDWQAGQLRDAG